MFPEELKDLIVALRMLVLYVLKIKCFEIVAMIPFFILSFNVNRFKLINKS